MTQPQIASFDQTGIRPVLSHAGRPLRPPPCPVPADPLTAADFAALIADPA